jgi:arginine:pyruvate transaminase
MKASNRISTLTGGGSDGWDLFYRARQMVADGQPIIELTIGEHDVRTDPSILSAMHASAMSGHTGYAIVPGTDALRRAVAKRIETRTGVPTGPNNIMITPGGQSALFAAHHATCDEGDKALYVDPYYATYPGTIRAVGAEPVSIIARPENAFQPQAADIAAFAADARSLLINTPNNPTGVVYAQSTLEGIAKVSEAHDLWLISDEVYDTQIWQGTHLSPRALPDMAKRTLVVGSMSKSHAMTGSRIGWVCGPEEIIAHLITLATHTTYGVAGFVQDAATFALNAGNDLEEQVAAPFRRRRLMTMDAINAQNIVRAVPAQGAMYVMLDIRATGLNSSDFANQLLEAEKIAVMPGESFGAAARGHVRVAMTVDDVTYIDAIQRILAFAKTFVT